MTKRKLTQKEKKALNTKLKNDFEAIQNQKDLIDFLQNLEDLLDINLAAFFDMTAFIFSLLFFCRGKKRRAFLEFQENQKSWIFFMNEVKNIAQKNDLQQQLEHSTFFKIFEDITDAEKEYQELINPQSYDNEIGI